MPATDVGIITGFKGIGAALKGAQDKALAEQLALAKIAQSNQLLQAKTLAAQMGGDSPAALQIANEYAKARAAGDTQRMNDIELFTKALDKGLVTGVNGVQAMGGYAPAVAGIAAAKTGAQEKIKKDIALEMNPEIKREEARAAALGKEAGTAEGALEKKYITAPQMNELIQQAKPLLEVATGDWWGRREKGLNAITGKSTDATQADKQLNVISAALTGNVPRFEGPQGVLDVELYKQAAGDLANPEIPRGDRVAALKTIEALNNKYMTTRTDGAKVGGSPNQFAPEAGAPIINPKTRAVGGSPAVKVGTIKYGYKFLGGDPADQTRWKKVK